MSLDKSVKKNSFEGISTFSSVGGGLSMGAGSGSGAETSGTKTGVWTGAGTSTRISGASGTLSLLICYSISPSALEFYSTIIVSSLSYNFINLRSLIYFILTGPASCFFPLNLFFNILITENGFFLELLASFYS